MRTRRYMLVGACLAVSIIAMSGGGPVTAADGEIVFGPTVAVSADETQAAAEPSIRTARDGTIYIAAPKGLGNTDRNGTESTGGDVIWRSDDGGITWTFLGSLDENLGGGDADIAVDDEGTVWGTGLTVVNTTASISTNKGDSFTVNPIGSLSTGDDRQWIETYKGEPFAFLATGEIGTRQVILSRLERLPGDIPQVSNTVHFPDPSGQGYQWPGEMAVDEKNDFVFVSYNTFGSPDSENVDDIVVGRTDLNLGGLQQYIAATTVGDTFDSFTGLDVDKAGNVYVVWSERRPKGEEGKKGHTNSYLAISEDSGESWGAPIRLNHRPRTTAFPWVVAGSDGRVAIAYYGTRRTGPSPETVTREGRRVPKWRVFVAYSMDATSNDPTWHEKAAMPLSDYLHKGNVCTSGTGCASGTRDLLDYFQIDLDPCGNAVITYTDNSNDVVAANGERTSNLPEVVSFVGQKSGPKFYDQPLNPDVC